MNQDLDRNDLAMVSWLAFCRAIRRDLTQEQFDSRIPEFKALLPKVEHPKALKQAQ